MTEIIIRQGKSARRYWSREQVERLVREGTPRDVAEHLPQNVQADLIRSTRREDRELYGRHFVKLETDAINEALGRGAATDPVVRETEHAVSEARKRLKRRR